MLQKNRKIKFKDDIEKTWCRIYEKTFNKHRNSMNIEFIDANNNNNKDTINWQDKRERCLRNYLEKMINFTSNKRFQNQSSTLLRRVAVGHAQHARTPVAMPGTVDIAIRGTYDFPGPARGHW